MKFPDVFIYANELRKEGILDNDEYISLILSSIEEMSFGEAIETINIFLAYAFFLDLIKKVTD